MVRKGYPVTIGVYMNQYLFYGSQSSSAGDSDYDHIVSVAEIMSNYNDGEIFSHSSLLFPNYVESQRSYPGTHKLVYTPRTFSI